MQKRFIQSITVFVLMLISLNAQSQVKKYSVSGTIYDSLSGESVIGGIVRIKEIPNAGASSNAYGFYSLTLPEGDYTLVVNYSGYEPYTRKIAMHSDLKADLHISPKQLHVVVITDSSGTDNLSKPQMGAEKISMRVVNKLPRFFGEPDPIKAAQYLPGVKSAGEGNSGFFVRGGSGDQNLILLDEAPVYNASHLLGFFSTFNSDALKDATLYKGAMPAQYGGRLSSVMDVRMKDGNSQRYAVSGGIGLIASKLAIEGPIKKDKGSFIVSGRRTYADMFLKLSSDSSINNSSLYFYDVNAKGNYQINDNNRIYVSGYFGRDNFGFGSNFGFDWGNATGTLRWNHLLNSRCFSNTSLIFSNYNYNINIGDGDDQLKVKSQIRDWNLTQEWQFFPSPKQSMRFGFSGIYHTITPGHTIVGNEEDKTEPRYQLDGAAWFSDEFKISSRLNLIVGLRMSSVSALGGKGNYYSYDSDGNVTDTISHSDFEFYKNYFYAEPRISASWLLDSSSSIKAGYARNTQSLHLLSNSTSSTPTDMWISSSDNVAPEISDQVSIGWYRNFNDNKFEFSVESYYKWMQNQIDYRDGADTRANEKVEGELLYGKGRAYGIEFLLKKNAGKFSGWVGYTLSRTERQFDGINNGDWFVARQDRTHDISVVALYDLTDRWSLSATWVYSTGNAVTFPSGKYEMNGQILYYYTERNGYRMPAYHRLDLGANWTIKKTDKRESALAFSLYNAYGRENAYSISFRQSTTDPTKTEAVQLALFKYIPSVSWNFKF